MARETVMQRVTNALEGIVIGKSRRNSDALLFEIRKWQEAKSLSERRLKEAWALAEAEGLVKSDDELRELEKGSIHIVTEAGRFSVTAQVGEGMSLIDPEALQATLVTRFKVTPVRAANAIAASMKTTKARLTKRVLEAGEG